MRVLAALSGGVDSTVAASIYVRNKFHIDGIYLSLWGGEAHSKSCSTADANAARASAQELGIDLYEKDLTDRFQAEIVDPYAEALNIGNTLSPCVNCNKLFKLEYLLEYAIKYKYDQIITGHYATASPKFLSRGVDGNDQSYFLWKMSDLELKYFTFPLGPYSKPTVRQFARNTGLSVADRPDSTDLCFNPKSLCGDSRELHIVGEGVVPQGTVRPGEVTVGQRRGLPVEVNDGEPRYVTNISRTEVTLGRKEDLRSYIQPIRDVVWHCDVDNPKIVCIQKSSQGPVVLGEVDNEVIIYSDSQRKVAPGQDIVFYDRESNTRVLGGGIAA